MPKLSHCLWFENQAEEAANFYVSVFKNGSIGRIAKYGEEGFEIHGMPAGTVMTVEFELEGLKYLALNGGPIFKFNESISIMVSCESQEEIDYLWNHLSRNGEEGPCGWLKDKYGLSWQVVPSILADMMADPDHEKTQRVMKAFLQMKKFDIETLKRAYQG